jgi:hypothetical protein
MAIDVAGASAYFAAGRHIRASVWARYSDGPTRQGAVAHALAMVRRLLPEGVTIDAATTAYTDFPRYDAAVYEQALHLLENGPGMADGGANAPRILAETDGPVRPRATLTPPMYAPECINWLTLDAGRAVLANG